MRFKVKYISAHGHTLWWREPRKGMTWDEGAAHIFTKAELLSRTDFTRTSRFKPGSGRSGVRLKLVP